MTDFPHPAAHPQSAPRIIAHRGGAAERPQNTLSAFRACVGSGIDGVELDIHRSSDGALVVHHDAWLDTATNGSGPLADQTAESLGRLRVKGEGEGPPTLMQTLEVLATDAELELHLEIKADHRGEVADGRVAETMAMAAEFGVTERMVVTSFRMEDLEQAVVNQPGVRTALAIQLSTSWMVGGLFDLVDRGLAIPNCLISLETWLARSNLEALLERAPGRLGVWNADDKEALLFWLAQPIVQVITDRPTLALRLRER